MKALGWMVWGMMAWASVAQACFPVPMSLEQRMAAGQAVYEGTVTAISMPELEARLLKEAVAVTGQQRVEPQPMRYRVVVRKRIKGKNETERVLVVNILPCGGGKASLGDEVILIQTDGFWYITPKPEDTN